MIDIKTLRFEIQLNKLDNSQMVLSPLVVGELLDRLEAAEAEALEEARLNGMGGEREAALMAKLEAAEKECNALRTKIEAMERQQPIAWTTELALRHGASALGFDACVTNLWSEKGVPLYALPGAQAQPAPSVPDRITPEQAPPEIVEYAPIAAEGYADGWNDCIRTMLAAAPKLEGE